MGQTTEATEALSKIASWNECDNNECYYAHLGVHIARRYHALMRAHYRRWHTAIVGWTALTSTGAFIAAISNIAMVWKMPTSNVVEIATGLAALACIIDLVIGFSKRADVHAELCRRFTDLAARMEEWEPNESNRRRAQAERLRIEMDEPTERKLIIIRARNDELRARGFNRKELISLTFLQEKLGYWFDYRIGKARKQHDQREKERSEERHSAQFESDASLPA